MKKIAAIILLTLICAATLIPLYAASTVDIANDTMLKGTPKIDGVIDAAYKSSLTAKIAPPQYAGDETKVTATVWALYDDKFIYICYSVSDEAVISADDEYIKTDAHPSVNDAVELRVGASADGVFPAYTSNPDHHLFMMDAYGKRVSCYKDSMSGYTGAAKVAADKKSYVVEIAIPISRALTETDVINMNFQIDDLQADGKCGYIGIAEAYNKLVSFKVSAAAAVTAPQTADPILTAVILIMVSGSAYVAAKKRK